MSSSWACGCVALLVVVGANGCDITDRLTAPYRYGVAQAVRSRGRLTTRPTSDGPVRLRGVLRGPAGRVTPAGTTAAAALYWVTATTGVRPRGSRSVQCFERLLEGVSLELSSGERVPLARWATVWDPSTELYEPRSTAQAQQFRQSSVVLLARTRDQTAVPAGVAAGCTSTQGTSHLYSERTAAEGSLIEISGCFRRGQLEPCEDGADAWCGSGDCEEFVRSNLRASR